MEWPKDIEDIFLYVLRERPDAEEVRKKMENLRPDDWGALVKFAANHGLSPVFYTRLKSLNLKDVPPRLLSKLDKQYLINFRKNVLFEQEVTSIITHLKKNNIPAIPLKGVVLSRVLYNNLALRQGSYDLDFLVHPEKIEETQKKLEEVGYSLFDNPELLGYYHTFNKQFNLSKPLGNGKSIILDLHSAFPDKFINTNIKDFWLNARNVNLDGKEILLPSNEDLLLYLTFTAINYFRFIEIKYLYDIHRLITGFAKDINWDSVANEAKQLNLDTALFFALSLAKDLFGTDISKEVLGRLRPGFIKERICKIWINKTSVLRLKEKIAPDYIWRLFAYNYLYSKNIFGCIIKMFKRIFRPMGEVMGMKGRPISEVSYSLYIKRLLKPFICFKQRYLT